MEKKKEHPKVKSRLHSRNRHRERYNFKQLTQSCPELAPFVTLNKYNDESIDFANPAAVKMLNKALLQHHYEVENWDIPEGYLCPPIPGRADYIHHVADLLRNYNYGNIPKGSGVKCLDIGVGANCVYPVIGNNEYGWSFIGSDIDAVAIESATKFVESNPRLKESVELKWQKNPKYIFYGILGKDEFIDLSICNPPFHASLAEARAGTARKVKNLNLKKSKEPILNFGGQNSELWCEGGEKRFIDDMIHESKRFSNSCFWFSSLVSKESNVKGILRLLEKAKVTEVKTIPMGQGNKTSRIVAWTFFSSEQQKKWRKNKGK